MKTTCSLTVAMDTTLVSQERELRLDLSQRCPGDNFCERTAGKGEGTTNFQNKTHQEIKEAPESAQAIASYLSGSLQPHLTKLRCTSSPPQNYLMLLLLHWLGSRAKCPLAQRDGR